MTTPSSAFYKGYRFPAEIISHAVWLGNVNPLAPSQSLTVLDPSAWPPLSQAIADRCHIEQLLAYLGTLHDPAGPRVSDTALDLVAALLERAEAAEQRAELASQQASPEVRRPRAPRNPTSRQPPRPTKRIVTTPVHEFRGRICRVCGRQAPPQSAARRDDLRVCRDEACRREARRRDNLAKQRRSIARRQALSAQVDQAISTYPEPYQ